MDPYFAEHDVRDGGRSRTTGSRLGPGVAGTLQAAALLAQIVERGDRDDAETERLTNSLRALLESAMYNDPSIQGTPPASDDAIADLEVVHVAPRLGTNDEATSCAVCTELFEYNEPARKLPCGHIYHAECVIPWLKQHCSCPMCRHEILSNDPEYEQDKIHRQRQSAVENLRSSMYN